MPVAGGGEHLVTGAAEVALLQRMLLIRAFESRLGDLYTRGLLRGSAHSSIGQEAVAVGACAALGAEDTVTSTHRGHGHAIARGCEIGPMMAELLGREAGSCRGKGGSMHIADFSRGMIGANGIVGGGLGIAAGAALTAQCRGSGSVSLCFFGDGAINQGVFHEVANIAAIWRLPLVLLCENNRYAMSAHVEQMTSVADLSARAVAYGFPGETVDGMDVLAVRTCVAGAVARARAGEGPTLVVAECFRFEGHFAGDVMRYRDPAEAAAWRARDPVEALRTRLVADGAAGRQELAELTEKADAAVAAALVWAQEQPFPAPEQAWEDVLA